jgi:predicted AAA+ superfamily ATPase
MKVADHLVERRILAVASEHVADYPVVLLEGPRTVGKSTLLQQLAAHLGGRVIDLDEPEVLHTVASDPSVAIGGDQPVLIDEYQLLPEILGAIKARLNRSSAPGQFVLTGSSRHESLPRTAQALTGRVHRMQVLPLAQCEREGIAPDLVRAMFTAQESLPTSTVSQTTREDYVERVTLGGFPLALRARSVQRRATWFDDYVRLTLERDVAQLSRIRQAELLPRLLQRVAGQSAQILNASRIGSGLATDEKTVGDYLRLLDAVFLTHRLPSWDRTLTKRTKARPKVHMVDSGVAMRLLRLSAEKLSRRDPASLTEFGHPLETFVVNELLKEAAWTDEVSGYGHWRESDGVEVDLILESFDGGVVGCEVKATARVDAKDFAGLRRLRATLGETFICGVVFYLGTRSYNYDDRLYVIPVDRLWHTA